MADAKNREAPGVYATEHSAFPASIVGVETAVPVFVGYTETAMDPASGRSNLMTPVRIQTMADYRTMFGGNSPARFEVAADDGAAPDFQAGGAGYILKSTGGAQFNMFTAIEMFYANGGGGCFVVSTGSYETVTRQGLLDGLAAAESAIGPTMLVVPDACLLTEEGDYSAVAMAQLTQAGTLRDRMAILDLPGALDPASWTPDGLAAQRNAFYEAIAPAQAHAGFGAAYAPAMRVSVLDLDDVDFRNLQSTQVGSDLLKSLLVAEAGALYGAGTSKEQQILAKLDQAFPADIAGNPVAQADVAALNAFLANALPLYAQVESIVLERLNVSAPSGAMAGIWAATDSMRGVWTAPANVSVAHATQPEVVLTDAQQGPYASPLNGMAIDILRSFANRGTVVWGAGTLDGNSQDYRYIQVRRTLIYIEQSIKQALNQFVFAANGTQTWSAVSAMISSFLQTLWAQGGLVGARSGEAYSVQVGLGSTMTAQDIADGYMIVGVMVQMIHPAEFIELTFKQRMQGV